MKTGTGVQACLRNARGCNAGITDGFLCHDTHTKFHKDWFRYSKIAGGGNTQTYIEHGYLTSLLLFFRIRKIG
jgi:hypothetical protein